MDNSFHVSPVIKKVLCMMVVMLLVLSSMPLTVLASQDDQTEQLDGSLGYSLGYSTEEEELDQSAKVEKDTLEVSNEADLRALSERVNGGDAMSDFKVLLTDNIVVDSNTPWIPIGDTQQTPFSGEFDGQGYSITGFHVDQEINGGLFGYLKDAKIYSLTVGSFVALNSTGGMFYSTDNTDIDLSRSEENGNYSLLRATPFATFDVWTGARDISWYTPGQTSYIISDSADLAGLADLVNAPTTVDFYNTTIYLDADLDLSAAPWTAIGMPPMNSFAGNFVGQGHTITGLNGNPLFGFVTEATISDLTIDGANIDGSMTGASVAVLVANADNLTARPSEKASVSINNIHINNATVNAPGKTNVASILGNTPSIAYIYNQRPTISNCLVENTTLIGGSNVGGIAQGMLVGSIENCVVANSEIRSTTVGGLVGGIFGGSTGMPGSFSIRNCLVVGVDFKDSSKFFGVGYIAIPTDAITNVVVSDIKYDTTGSIVSADRFLAVNGVYTGGITNIFTDSPLEIGYVGDKTSASEIISAESIGQYPYGVLDSSLSTVVWDNIADHSVTVAGNTYLAPSTNTDYNVTGVSTRILTNGVWNLDSTDWVATTNAYPQIKSLANSSWNESVVELSALAAIALISTTPTDSYVTGSAEVLLPTHFTMPDGRSYTVSWSGYGAEESAGRLESETTAEGILLRAVGQDVTFDLTASLNGHTKDFPGVTLLDTVLEVQSYTPDGSVQLDADLFDGDIVVTFVDNIDYTNLAQAKQALLQVRRADGQFVTVDAIQLVNTGSPTDRFEITPGTADVKFNFPLSAGNTYRVVIPQGAVQAIGKDRCLSEEIIINLETKKQGSPSINFHESELAFAQSYSLSVDDLLKNLLINDFDGTNMFNGSLYPFIGSVPIEYTGPLWNDNNIDQSINDVLAAMPNNSIQYRVSDSTIFTSGREASTYQLYVMAKNVKGKTASRIMVFSILGNPVWEVEPESIAHISWTNDKDAVIRAAKQNAVAVIPQKSGVSLPCNITVSFSQDEWDVIEAAKEGPSKIVVTVSASNPYSGSSSAAALSKDVTVYLDKPLYWAITPSPVTMSLATKKQVEKKIDFRAYNFNSDIVEYEHWSNDYRVPGTYYVDVVSKAQFTTACQDPNCTNPDHPPNKVNDTFIVKIVETPGEEITSYWGLATAELASVGDQDQAIKESEYIYSKRIVSLSPTSYRLPSFVPEALKNQSYGMMQFDYTDYRWNLYSNSINYLQPWSDEYNLEATYSSVNNGSNNALEIDFVEEGRLFGTVEFEVNLDQARTISKNLPKENLGLYRYDGITKQLVLVSDIVVKDRKWASALIKEIYPTTYVLKARGDKDVVVNSSSDELVQFYMTTKVLDEETHMVKDGDLTLITLPQDQKELRALIDQTSAVNYDITDPDAVVSNSVPLAGALAAGAVLLVGGAVATVVLVRRKRGGQ